MSSIISQVSAEQIETAEIMDRLTTVFRDVFDNESLEITDSTTGDDIEDWDSIAYISLIVSIEREFDVKLIGQDIGTMRSVGDMARVIQRRLSDRRS